MKFTKYDARTQKRSLWELVRLARESLAAPRVVFAARKITNNCSSRDDECELNAIYEAVKHGCEGVPGLERGMRYVSDPRSTDFFTSPDRMLQLCENGACGGDCDEHAALIAALAGAIGFKSGLRVFRQSKSQAYVHIYAVVGLPKRQPTHWVALDTTVEQAGVGWEPPKGFVFTEVVISK